jgi:uncharacterized protein YndB with AHSA1/START domain
MPAKKDALGRRWVELEWLVPGTPEQVWQALATGPGISAWFMPTQLEEKVGGKLTFSFGEQGSSSGTVTGWDPPQRFAYEERDWAENAPPVATEVVVTARSGHECLVRMVHSLFASNDDWDDQLEGFEAGWPGFFEVLRIYMTHFAGAPSASTRASVMSSTSVAEAWAKLTSSLDLAGANVGERRRSPSGAPPLSGLVERVHQDKKGRELTLRLDQPGPGVAIASAYAVKGSSHAALWAYFYGENAKAHAAQIGAAATPWLRQLLPSSD